VTVTHTNLAPLPACDVEYSSRVVGTEYCEDAYRRASEALFHQSVEALDDDEPIRVAEIDLAVVPDLDNDYNQRALAVVLPAVDGSVSVDDRIGFLPDRRCATLQPRIVTLMRVTNSFVGVRGTATYVYQDDQWERSYADFRVCIPTWDVVHEHVLDIAREVEPDVEQPWIGHDAPLTELAKQLYAEGRGRDERNLVPVRYELLDDQLVATLDGAVVTNLSANRRDFFDLLRERVDEEGPLRGWVRLHKGGVEVRFEDRPE